MDFLTVLENPKLNKPWIGLVIYTVHILILIILRVHSKES